MQANVTMAANSARCGSQHDAANITDPWCSVRIASALVVTVAITPDEDFRSSKKAFARPGLIHNA
jgi:hypothetical protein